MSVQEILDAVRNGEVTAPVGTKTFCVFAVGTDGRLEMAGTADAEHAIKIAYALMHSVFGQQEGKQNAD